MKRNKRTHRLDRGMRGWIISTAKKNFWRVSSWYDLEDLIQDGYVCYCRCQERYSHIVDQGHFMSLVKITYINEIHDISKRASRDRSMIVLVDDNATQDAASVLEALMPPEPELATFAAMMAQLPTELKQLIRILLSDAKDIPYLQFSNGTRETTNDYLCRLINADPKKLNVERTFRAHFA